MRLIERLMKCAFSKKPSKVMADLVRPIICTDLDAVLLNNGTKDFQVGGSVIKLHLQYPHERRYAACLSAPLKYPQYDIDKLLINRFVASGDTVLDAGANIGLTALHFLENGAKQVTAIEALPELARRIRGIQNKKNYLY